MLITTMLAVAANAALVQAPEYAVEVFVQNKQGLFGTRSIKSTETVAMEEGEFEIYGNGSVMLEGDVSIDGDKVTVDMTICKPQASPCEVVATPNITFRMGGRASIRQTTGRSSYEVSFRPE